MGKKYSRIPEKHPWKIHPVVKLEHPEAEQEQWKHVMKYFPVAFHQLAYGHGPGHASAEKNEKVAEGINHMKIIRIRRRIVQ